MPLHRSNTKCSVLSFWMLLSDSVLPPWYCFPAKNSFVGLEECVPCSGSWHRHCQSCPTPESVKNWEDMTIQVTKKVTRDTLLDLEHLVQKRPQTNLHIRSDGFAWSKFSRRFACNTAGATPTEGVLLVHVVVRQRPSILELLSNEDQTLLVSRSAFLLLNLNLHVVDSVGRLNTGKTWQDFEIQVTKRLRTKIHGQINISFERPPTKPQYPA